MADRNGSYMKSEADALWNKLQTQEAQEDENVALNAIQLALQEAYLDGLNRDIH